MKKLIYLFMAALLMGGIGNAAFAAPLKARAEILNSNGQKVGRAIFTETGDGVNVSIEVSGIPPGNHGIHIHEVGMCDAPDFKTAGGHFNPQHKKHGLKASSGSHGGDLPNLKVEENELGRLQYLLKDLTLQDAKNSLLQAAGTSLVIHASYDDEVTDPAGNSGARIACGVIERVR